MKTMDKAAQTNYSTAAAGLLANFINTAAGDEENMKTFCSVFVDCLKTKEIKTRTINLCAGVMAELVTSVDPPKKKEPVPVAVTEKKKAGKAKEAKAAAKPVEGKKQVKAFATKTPAKKIKK